MGEDPDGIVNQRHLPTEIALKNRCETFLSNGVASEHACGNVVAYMRRTGVAYSIGLSWVSARSDSIGQNHINRNPAHIGVHP